jgi:16S rRNA (cytosine967-C5)-methyltransferase
MNARDFALMILDTKELPGWRAFLVTRARKGTSNPPILHDRRLQTPSDPRDLALGEQIIQGVIKNLVLLQNLIAHHSNRTLKSIDPLVQKILAIALYQLRFLTRIPASAAVDQAVEQSKRFGRTKAAGFVNAILRNATRNPDPTFPPEIALSHPKDLYQRLQSLLGPEDALRFCEHNQLEPPTIVRLASSLAETLAVSRIKDLAPDISLLHHQQPNLFVIQNAKRPHLAQLAAEGIAQVQDTTAAAVVPRMDLHPGHLALDRCAGRGTKTLQIREAVTDAGQVHAIDAAKHRIESLRALITARHLTNVHAHHASWLRDLPSQLPQQFDRILIDAPCSNSGVLARRPEARYHQSPSALKSLEKLQDDILNDTAPATKPAALLVYSTCSVWPEENQHRIQHFLSTHSDFELVEEKSTLPSFTPDPTQYRDGGYYAVLRRI